MKQCPRCLFDSEIATIGDKQCNYCDLHDTLEKQSNPADLNKALDKIRKIDKQYNCIVGISGGLDSSTLLYAAVKMWGLRPLVIHFDNRWNNAIAKQNMDRLVDHLNVNVITYKVDKKEYDDLNLAFLRSGLPDADIPNDIAMTKLMYDTADKCGIKYILNGHDFRTEGSTPAKWTYMDAKYIQSVYETMSLQPLKNYPLFTFKDQIIYALKGIKQVRPFHYGFNRKLVEDLMIEKCGWESYGGKHCENIYTEFIGSYLLPVKFGIDKRRVYLSARIRSGNLDKATALEMLANKPEFDFDKFGDYKSTILKNFDNWVGFRTSYDKYNFKKYRILIWILVKLKVVPYTFYKKYCFD
jgi:hypothetical protein